MCSVLQNTFVAHAVWPTEFLVNPHQRCGDSNSLFARIHYFYIAGSGNGLEGSEGVCPPKLTLRKRHFFLIEKYNEDAGQDEKHIPDLLESIIQPPGLVKEELRPILLKGPICVQNPKMQGFNFLDSGSPKFSRRRPTQPSRSVSFEQSWPFPCNIWPRASGQISEKIRTKIVVLAPLGLVTLFKHTLAQLR